LPRAGKCLEGSGGSPPSHLSQLAGLSDEPLVEGTPGSQLPGPPAGLGPSAGHGPPRAEPNQDLLAASLTHLHP
jgi:hypothetical protein